MRIYQSICFAAGVSSLFPTSVAFMATSHHLRVSSRAADSAATGPRQAMFNQCYKSRPTRRRAGRNVVSLEASDKVAEEDRAGGDGPSSASSSADTSTLEDRKAEISKQVYQSNMVVGTKLMTISSFGPDSAPSRGGGIGRNKVVSRPSPVAPERLLPEVIARQEKLFEKRKWRLIGDNVFVGLLGTSGAWCVSFKAACSYGLGATLGTAYLVLLSRFVENLGKDDTGGGGRGGGGGGGPARLALAGLLVLLVSKNKETFEFIPALTGFLAYQVSTLVQGIYTDFDDLEDSEAEST